MTLVFLLAFLGVGNVYEGRVVRVMLRSDSHTYLAVFTRILTRPWPLTRCSASRTALFDLLKIAIYKKLELR